MDQRRLILGGRVAALREKAGLTQQQLAMMVGTSKSFIWKIETGRIAASVDTLCKIADALDAKVSELIEF